jgi:hypothetical protein
MAMVDIFSSISSEIISMLHMACVQLYLALNMWRATKR